MWAEFTEESMRVEFKVHQKGQVHLQTQTLCFLTTFFLKAMKICWIKGLFVFSHVPLLLSFPCLQEYYDEVDLFHSFPH